MAQFEVKPKDQQIWRVVYETETTIIDVNKVIDEKNRRYLSGKIRFLANLEYQYFYDKKQNGYKEIEIRYGETGNYIYGLISLIGEWNYRQKHCLLEIKSNDNYDEFEQLLDNEEYQLTSKIEFDYTSWINNIWGTGSYIGYYDEYVNCSAKPDPPEWENGKSYNGLTEYPNGSKAGDSDVAVLHNSKIWLSIVPLNEFEPGVGDGAFTWLDITSNYSVAGQERALFQFNEDAIFSDQFSYWYKGGCTVADYTDDIKAYNIPTVINDLLHDTGFELDSDWLNYAENINSRYKHIYIANTESPEKLTLSEVINHVELLFNCKWRLDGYYLTFKHWSELISEIKGAVPKEHDFEDRLNIQSFKGDDSGNVFEHLLNFTKSNLATHENSVIDYDNNFTDRKEVKGSFDVDFVYAYNKGGKNIPITRGTDNKVLVEDGIYNPDFVPSIIHENFYLVGREFETGELNGVETPLELNYSEQAETEASPELDFNVFDMTKNVKLAYGLGRFKSIEFNINDNKYKMTLAIQKPY